MPDLSRDKPLTYRELWKKLKKFGVQQFKKGARVVIENYTIQISMVGQYGIL
jgi:hypothetical protein